MPERLLQLDDLRSLASPDRVASLFGRLGYNAEAQPLNLEDLQLTSRSAEAVYDAHLIADQGDGGLQVLLFQLQPEEWSSPSVASSRMKAIASQVGRRDTEFLLLATKDYNQLMLVNPRKSFDDKMNLKASIRKLLIDRTNPTAYDLDRLEAIAVREKSPQELYKAQCEAFDVEKLTKAFYRGYKQLFDKVQQGVKRHNNHPYFDDPDHLHQFSQRLLGRLMFLYFLQKKEFLAGDRRFLTTQYQRLRADPEDTEYYTSVLEPLFFETLNQSRPNLESKWGKTPYLNGGLFDRDYGTGIKDAAGRLTPEIVTLPNGLFDPGDTDSILGFFNSYNFTISENTSGDEDVAVDPEMLGKVFENMLAAEERGQSGTFYTPRGIVQFMCSEVLSRYLADETEMSLEVLQKLIEYDPDLADSEFNQLMSPQQARELKKAIASLKVLDPAVGSGAFPLGMMQVILNVRQAIARREGMKVSRGSLTISQWKRDIIANNLYGVDIKPEAIEIAKLRMWLSLVVDIPNIEDVEPLPNLDYKLMCGDSLISTIHGEQLIPDPTKIQQGMLAVTPIQIAIAPLLELEKRYFDAQTEERHRLREQILEAEANVFRVAVSDRHQYWLGKQKELETKIKTMKARVSKAQEKEKAEIATKLAELDKFAKEVEGGERSLNFFQYHLHFRDVFESKGGFDVVIGNPPYVGEKGNKDVFREVKNGHLGVFYQKKMDLFYFFFHLALNLGSERVNIAFITTNYFITATSGKTLRQDIKNRAILRKIINFNELKIFESALGQHNMITVFQKGTDAKAICDTTIIKRKGFATTEILSRIFEQSDTETNYCKIPQISLYDGDEVYIRLNNNQNKNGASIQTIIDKIQSDSLLLGDICNVNQGLRTGADKVSQKHIESHSIINVNKGDGIFIISERELLRLNLNETELLKIKPLFKNSDINRYFCCKKSQYYLIDIFYPNDKNINTNQIPNIIKHLQKFKPILESRKENANGIDKAILMGKWWFASVRRKLDFDSEKIVSPQRAKRNIFGYNSIPWYASADVYFITQKNATYSLKYVLSLLNSKLYFLWLFHRGKRKGNILELYQKPLSEIPIKQLTYKEQELLINLVDKILTITGKDDYLKDKKKQAEVSNLEAEIDKLIYQLYGLTDEEVSIIENAV